MVSRARVDDRAHLVVVDEGRAEEVTPVTVVNDARSRVAEFRADELEEEREALE